MITATVEQFVIQVRKNFPVAHGIITVTHTIIMSETGPLVDFTYRIAADPTRPTDFVVTTNITTARELSKMQLPRMKVDTLGRLYRTYRQSEFHAPPTEQKRWLAVRDPGRCHDGVVGHAAPRHLRRPLVRGQRALRQEG